MDWSLTCSSVHGILQGRVLQWVAISFSRGSSQPGNQIQVSCIAGRFFTNWEGNGNPLQYPCLENPVVGGTWWVTVHGVPKCQTRLETSLSLSLPSEPLGKPQGLPFSRRSSWPRDRAQVPRIAGGFFIIRVTREVFSLLMENLLSEWKLLSRVWLFATPWTIQSMEFSRPEYWSGEPFPSPGNLSNPGIKPRSPALKANSLPAEPQEKPMRAFYVKKCIDKYGKFSTIRQLTPTGKRGNVPKH